VVNPCRPHPSGTYVHESIYLEQLHAVQCTIMKFVLIIIGGGAMGKTAITIQYIQNEIVVIKMHFLNNRARLNSMKIQSSR
jgi:hypothetical protein